MYILAFDTCLGACSVALGRAGPDGPFLITRERRLMAQGHAEALMPMMARVLADAGLAVADLDRIAVTHGPGTFTGTRIGIAAARGLMLAAGVPALGFSSLLPIALAAAERLCSSGVPAAGSAPDAAIAVVVDARRGQCYVQVLERDGRELTAPLLLEPAMAASLCPDRRLVAVGSGASMVAEAGMRLGRPIDVVPASRLPPEELEPDAARLIAVARTVVPTGEPPSPLYMRPPDARPQSLPGAGASRSGTS